MSATLRTRQVSELCLGKPALRWLSATATVADAISALKRLGETYLSVWACHCGQPDRTADCRCLGKVCTGNVICFLARDENLRSPATALQAPVSVLLPKLPGLIRHLRPYARLLDAIDLILEGAQNLVIPIESKNKKTSTSHNDGEYCWLTQEDVIRYLLNCIGSFSPTPASPVGSLGLVEEVLAVCHEATALSVLPLISEALARQTSVAVVDGESRLVGEISPLALNTCDETAAAAIAALSAGDLMTYIKGATPPEDLVQLVLKDGNCGALLDCMEESSTVSSSSSSDEDLGSARGGSGRLGGSSSRNGRRSEAVVVNPRSSLVAVMIQALTHRSGYAWVVEDDRTLNGIVTFSGMLRVFRARMNTM